MKININRIINDIDKISKFNTTPDKGITRVTYSDEYKMANEYLIEEFNKLGMEVKIDGVGNVRARLVGSNPELPVIMSGSHIDTVRHGGKFDGVLGCVCALEAVRTIIGNNISINNSIDIVIFAEEEGSNFGSSLAGSKFMTGGYDLDDIKSLKDEDGISMYEKAINFGLTPDKESTQVLTKDQVKAMVELHIEQGEVLDNENLTVGVVQNIYGAGWYNIEITGVSNHAGATPMYLRKDPLVAAARIIQHIEKVGSHKVYETTVATVGKISCHPNSLNSIPGKVNFTVDIRDANSDGIDIVVNEIKSLIEEINGENKVKAKIESLGSYEPIVLSDKIVNIIRNIASDSGIKYKMMNSGAGHDSSTMAQMTDTGMIFVPSIGGRSHVPEEDTDYEDIKIGCDLLLKTLVHLANEK